MAALLAALVAASPASAAGTLTADDIIKHCPPGQVDYSTSGAAICGHPIIDKGMSGRSITDWFSGTIISHVPQCPDGWHLVLTQGFAPMCAWVLREPGY